MNPVRLDDLYYMVAHIYGERNADRSVTATFTHFVEVCGMLTAHDRKKRDTISIEDALCKALGWYFPLLAKLRVTSVEDLIFRKFPFVCPYCRKRPHQDGPCKLIKGTESTVDHDALRSHYSSNVQGRPVGLNDWQKMFDDIYPRQADSHGRSVIGLFEELGEFAEAIRVFERHPKYLAGEAADVFSYLMGIANEHSLREAREGREFSFEAEFLRRFPGLCIQCGCLTCTCPAIPEATVGRMAKELDVGSLERLFQLDSTRVEERALSVSPSVMERMGGYNEVLKKYPFDRGEASRALTVVCLQVADGLDSTRPEVAARIRQAVTAVVASVRPAGTQRRAQAANVLVELLQSLLKEGVPMSFGDGATIPERVIQTLHVPPVARFHVGVVTALPKEFAAMRTMLDNVRNYSVSDDPNDYVIGQVAEKNGAGLHEVVLTLLKRMGNNSASGAVTHLLRSFPNVQHILMVGIAGGVPNADSREKHVRLGDVVVSVGGVVQYDNLKIGTDEVSLRGHVMAPSAALVGKANILEANRIAGDHPWEDCIARANRLEGASRPDASTDKLYSSEDSDNEIAHPVDPDRRMQQPKVVFGRIGAANTLLKNPSLRNLVGTKLDVRAIEMEGSGIADAAWMDGKSCVLIRGVVDYCDSFKNDIWQAYGAAAAAAVARSLIELLPLSSTNDATHAGVSTRQ